MVGTVAQLSVVLDTASKTWETKKKQTTKKLDFKFIILPMNFLVLNKCQIYCYRLQ